MCINDWLRHDARLSLLVIRPANDKGACFGGSLSAVNVVPVRSSAVMIFLSQRMFKTRPATAGKEPIVIRGAANTSSTALHARQEFLYCLPCVGLLSQARQGTLCHGGSALSGEAVSKVCCTRYVWRLSMRGTRARTAAGGPPAAATYTCGVETAQGAVRLPVCTLAIPYRKLRESNLDFLFAALASRRAPESRPALQAMRLTWRLHRATG